MMEIGGDGAVAGGRPTDTGLRIAGRLSFFALVIKNREKPGPLGPGGIARCLQGTPDSLLCGLLSWVAGSSQIRLLAEAFGSVCV